MKQNWCYNSLKETMHNTVLYFILLASKLVLINKRQNRPMSLVENEERFRNKFDQLQGEIEAISECDELIAGKKCSSCSTHQRVK